MREGRERESAREGVKELESSVSGNGRTRSSGRDRDTYIRALHGLQEGRNGKTSSARVGSVSAPLMRPARREIAVISLTVQTT